MRSLWARLLTALVVALMMSSSTLAWALPCCAHDDAAPSAGENAASPGKGDGCCPHASDAENGSDNDDSASESPGEDGDDGTCSCPVGCSPCCAGMPAQALMPLSLLEHAQVGVWTVLELTYPDRAPPDGAQRDVIHVPRRRA